MRKLLAGYKVFPLLLLATIFASCRDGVTPVGIQPATEPIFDWHEGSYWGNCAHAVYYNNWPTANFCLNAPDWDYIPRSRYRHALNDIGYDPIYGDDQLAQLCTDIWYTVNTLLADGNFWFYGNIDTTQVYGYTYTHEGYPNIDLAEYILDDYHWNSIGVEVTIHEAVHVWQLWKTGDMWGDANQAQAEQLARSPQYGGCNMHSNH